MARGVQRVNLAGRTESKCGLGTGERGEVGFRVPAVIVFRPYQLAGSAWLQKQPRAAGLFDDAGLGKTLTAIHAARSLGVRKLLVVAPSIVLFNWQREVEVGWPGRRVQVIDTGAVRVDAAADVVVVTHGLLLRVELFAQLVEVQWDLLVLDEAHFFRGPTAQRAQLFYGLQKRSPLDVEPPPPALVSAAERVWLLTATPMPNDCSELWTHYRGLWPERIPGKQGPMTHAEWLGEFCRVRQTLFGPKVVGNKNLAKLRQVIDGTFLRRLKKNVLAELPAIRFEVVTLKPEKLPWELRELEGKIRPKALAAAREQVEGAADPKAAGAAWQALKQEEDYARWAQLAGLAKAETIVELLRDELETKALSKVVVFGWHLAVLDVLAQGLAKFGVVVVTGEVSAQDRQERIDRFQRDDGVRVFVGNIRAAGTGATLTAASEVVFAEMSFTPGDNSQAADRCHRIGQTEKVRVRCIALANTVDEDLTNALRRKVKMVQEILR